MSDSIQGKRITPLHFMSRLDYLEQMVCELRDVLGRYAAKGNDADIILKKYFYMTSIDVKISLDLNIL